MLLRYAGSFRYTGSPWGPGLITFCLGWLLFFTTAFLLRIIFPVMAREQNSAWYLFSLPLPPERIVISVIKACVGLSAVFGVFSVVLWLMIPIPAASRVFLSVWSIWTIGLLALLHATAGMINPNFADGADPERVSTSVMGMVALGSSMLIIGVVCLGVYTFLRSGVMPAYFWIAFVLLSMMPFFLLTRARESVSDYEF